MITAIAEEWERLKLLSPDYGPDRYTLCVNNRAWDVLFAAVKDTDSAIIWHDGALLVHGLRTRISNYLHRERDVPLWCIRYNGILLFSSGQRLEKKTREALQNEIDALIVACIDSETETIEAWGAKIDKIIREFEEQQGG